MSTTSPHRIPLVGPGGEPVDLWRTFLSHGVAALPPMQVDEQRREFSITLEPGRTITVASDGAVRGADDGLLPRVLHVLRLDEDLSGFYALIAGDPALAWAVGGAGRMIRSETVFEDVVKTICTTNCAWSATERMVGAIVNELGGGAFPTPAAMAEAGEEFYRDVARAGYRGRYLMELSRAVADGSLDLESYPRLSPDELEKALLALPGVGPYAAAHIMMMVGCYSKLILDSWTRPKYARLVGARRLKDSTIERRFRRYGAYAGLAFWLFLTEDWVPAELPDAGV
jgi:3-methyladenine DNA glycosylase/8-oxoguanine DNA glycosylase